MKQIPNFPCYGATEDGNIYRLSYQDPGNKAKRSLPHLLIGKPDKNGYLRLNLSVKQKVFYKRINRLIAETFIPNPNNLPMVNHKNGIKTDNRVENLEWISPRDNVKHAHATGLHRGCRTKVVLYNSTEKLIYDSVEEAAKALHHSRDCFRRRLTEDSRHGIIDGWAFELVGGKERKLVVHNGAND